jgi:hypothetical protein
MLFLDLMYSTVKVLNMLTIYLHTVIHEMLICADLNVKLKVFTCMINCVKVRSHTNKKYEISLLLHLIMRYL